jgi:hypothetical protein
LTEGVGTSESIEDQNFVQRIIILLVCIIGVDVLSRRLWWGCWILKKNVLVMDIKPFLPFFIRIIVVSAILLIY